DRCRERPQKPRISCCRREPEIRSTPHDRFACSVRQRAFACGAPRAKLPGLAPAQSAAHLLLWASQSAPKATENAGESGTMDAEALATLVFGLIGGLGIFLLGMKNLSDGMQAVAGSSLRRMIAAVTNNRLLAA